MVCRLVLITEFERLSTLSSIIIGELPLMTSKGISVGFPRTSAVCMYHVPITGLASAHDRPHP